MRHSDGGKSLSHVKKTNSTYIHGFISILALSTVQKIPAPLLLSISCSFMLWHFDSGCDTGVKWLTVQRNNKLDRRYGEIYNLCTLQKSGIQRQCPYVHYWDSTAVDTTSHSNSQIRRPKATAQLPQLSCINDVRQENKRWKKHSTHTKLMRVHAHRYSFRCYSCSRFGDKI